MWRQSKRHYLTNYHLFPLLFCLSLFFLFLPELAFSKSKYSMLTPIDVNSAILEKRIKFKWGQDPFLKKPGFSDEKETSIPLNLNTIFIGENNEKMAIINDTEVYEGSVLDGFHIKNIGKNFVVLKKGHYLKELNLPTQAPQKVELSITSHPLRQPAHKKDK